MSFFDRIGSFFSGLGSIPGELLKAAEAAWKAIQTVWSWLTRIGQLLTDAWTWMVNGAEWFGSQVAGWSQEVFRTLWQTLTSTIPGAIAWVFGQAVHWAAGAIHELGRVLRVLIGDVRRFLVGLIHTLVNALKAALHSFVHWATGPVKWVLKWGAWLIRLITHPANLANWIASSIVAPIVKWFLKSGADVVVWLLRRSIAKNSELVHLVEDVLHRML